LGHLVRSLALAQMLLPAFEPHFLIQSPAPAVAGMISDYHFAFTALPATDQYEQEARHLLKTRLQAGDLVVLDGYHFNTSYQDILKQKPILLVCIDDLQAFPFVADVVINQAGGLNPGRYQVQPHTRLCLGPGYALLRQPFLQAALGPRPVTTLDRIFLNMGGADPGNDTCRVLADLTRTDPAARVEVVTGSAYPFTDALSTLVHTNPRIRVHQNLSAEDMCRLMQSCQAAILPPSSVSYEWCSVGGPLFLYQTADNQSAMRAFLKEEHLAEDWENYGAWRRDLHAAEDTARQIARQRKFFGGQSPKNLRSVFHQLYYQHWLELRPAQPEDVMILYHWANDPTVRENSFTQSAIPLEVHKIWYENKIKDPACLFLVARVQGMPAGMIRYDLKEGQGVISYLIDQEFRGKSLGAILLQKGEEALKNQHPETGTLIGQVQETNLASVISFQKSHYTLSHTVPPFKPGALVFEKRII
jgi:UDP-2,4-diacetamido-2,4,6-trideoxy-beta-L-altropyranose hydrolase